MNCSHLLTATACLALHGFSFAQGFNLDVGIGNAIPSATFGAAAGQAGVWNQIPAVTTVQPLVDLTGAATSVTAQRTSGTAGNFYVNNAGTFGDDDLLLDDGEFPPSASPSVWTISGLAAGSYTVYTYAWAPDSPLYFSGVSVNGSPVTPVGGAWTGSYQVGVTHAVDTVTIATGGTIVITISTYTTFATFDGVQIQPLGSAFPTFCSGDGSGTACPCGNSGLPGNGCANSVNANGAHLSGSGSASVSADTLVLNGSGMTNTSVLYFQGATQVNGGNGAVFGDGLRCAGPAVIRLGTKTNSAGSSSYPGAGDPLISVKGNNVAGNARAYQAWYRNADTTFCPPATFNLTNGLSVTWTP